MNTCIRITTIVNDNEIIKSCDFPFHDSKQLWFSFPKKVKNDLTDRMDPFVQVLIFPMMEKGGTFKFCGHISKSCLENLIMFNRIWHIWLPEKYHLVKIIADKVDDDSCPKRKKAITAFSGGLDAAYTLYKHKEHLDKDFLYNIDKSVMIHGADIPLANEEQFETAFVHAKGMTDSLSVDLIPVKTNYREVEPDCWEHKFGTVVSSVLSFFSKKYYYGLMASGDSLHNFTYPWGTNPITDEFLSNDVFRFVVDGYEHTRTERANFVKNWQKCLENLRVCWCNQDKSKNCGCCEKCVRTKLNFLACGIKHLPTMPTDFSYKDLDQKYMIKSKHNIMFFQEILDYAKTYDTLTEKEIMILSRKIKKWNKLFRYKKKT